MNQINEIKKIINLSYYHITYCGSIFCSAIIWFLTQGFTQCGDPFHNYIYYLIKLKSFFLYDSTSLEYLHHFLQYFVNDMFYSNKYIICNPNIIETYKIGYGVLITPIFNNIKNYYNPSSKNVRFLLDIMTFISFIYYRFKWNYCYLFGNGMNAVNQYIFYNIEPFYHYLFYIIVHPSLFLFCMMNFYWGTKIINKISMKLLKLSN